MSTLAAGLTELFEKLEGMTRPDTPESVKTPAVLDSKWDGRNTFTVPEAAEILGISKWLGYEAVKKKQLPVIWIGRRCLVPRRALEKMLEGVAA